MAEEATAGLEKLRSEIDRIDSELHRLIRERAAVVNRIAVSKRNSGGQSTAFIRPGREADVLRGLMERHEGAMPAAVVARIWRELIALACQMQMPFRVALYAPERSIAHWDIVRNHFGSHTPIVLCGSAHRVLQELAYENTIGVLPYPEHDEANPWWPHLVSGDGSSSARIVTELPFFESYTGAFESRRLMVVATYPPEPSLSDRSFLAVSSGPELSRTRLATLLDQGGLKGSVIASQANASGMEQLLEVSGFVTTGDDRVATLVQRSDGAIRRAVPIGATAVPIGMLDRG